MRVLVACEYSATVRDAFRARGFDAWSCDLLPTEGDPRWHIQGDALAAAYGQSWDLMIAHPPCTYLSVSGMHWTTRGLRDPQLTEDALSFVGKLLAAPIPHIAVENPVSVISTRLRKPDQIIQPWWFGDNASKKTCLWLQNLPALKKGASPVPPRGYQAVRFADQMPPCDGCDEPLCAEHKLHFWECDCIGPMEDDCAIVEIDGFLFGRRGEQVKTVWGNQTASGQNKLAPSPDRWKERSRTFPGIAAAMADQWGSYLSMARAA